MPSSGVSEQLTAGASPRRPVPSMSGPQGGGRESTRMNSSACIGVERSGTTPRYRKAHAASQEPAHSLACPQLAPPPPLSHSCPQGRKGAAVTARSARVERSGTTPRCRQAHAATQAPARRGACTLVRNGDGHQRFRRRHRDRFSIHHGTYVHPIGNF